MVHTEAPAAWRRRDRHQARDHLQRLDSLACLFHRAPFTRFGRVFTLALHFHTRSTLSTIPSLFLLGCHSRSSSHALTLPRSSYFHSLLVSILVNLLSSPTASWSIRLAAPSLLRCPILDASSSLPYPRCLLLAVSSSLPYPCCLILAASPSLQRPRSNFSSSHPSHC